MASTVHDSLLLRRLDPNLGCTAATCDVSESVYGYRPSLAATVVFLTLFILSGGAYLVQGIRTRTWFFTAAMMLGCVSEALGYVAKLLLWRDPFSDPGFEMSVVLFTFAPAFYSAGLYYTLKHICLTFGAEFSRLKPSWYTYVFVACDIFSIVLQAIGGGIAIASPNFDVLDVGDDIMIAGLAAQVFTMVAFGALVADYGRAVWKNRAYLNPETVALRSSWRFKCFLAALGVAYVCILIRCSYRVAELVRGWIVNPILRDQGLFIGLDSAMCGIASVVLNLWHPGWCFPKQQQDITEEVAARGGTADQEKLDVRGTTS